MTVWNGQRKMSDHQFNLSFSPAINHIGKGFALLSEILLHNSSINPAIKGSFQFPAMEGINNLCKCHMALLRRQGLYAPDLIHSLQILQLTTVWINREFSRNAKWSHCYVRMNLRVVFIEQQGKLLLFHFFLEMNPSVSWYLAELCYFYTRWRAGLATFISCKESGICYKLPVVMFSK